jgi:hypothetical protein
VPLVEAYRGRYVERGRTPADDQLSPLPEEDLIWSR